MKAWYFAHESNKLQYGDGRGIKIGETHTVDCVPQCCKQGLHGSLKLIDALGYAKGPIVYRVDIKGKIDKEQDKICGQSRTYLYGGINIEKELHEFSRWCALQVIHLWNAPQVVKEYLKTGDESLRDDAWAATGAATGAAAWAAVRAATGAAAWDAAWAAAMDDAWAAAWAAVRAATGAAAWDDAWAAAWDKQNRKFTQLINKAIRSRT